MQTLPTNIDTFAFANREKLNGITAKYKCGRDFLYYALHYYFPSTYNLEQNNPCEIDNKKLFGQSVPAWLAWTQIQFFKVPQLLKKHNLELVINRRKISHYIDFVTAILFSRISHDKAVEKIEENIKNGIVSGVDVALRFGGLEDHIMFVYGFDEENLYVCDTHKVPYLNYEKITDDNRFYMKLSRAEIRARWKRFSRVWEVRKVAE